MPTLYLINPAPDIPTYFDADVRNEPGAGTTINRELVAGTPDSPLAAHRHLSDSTRAEPRRHLSHS